jgi:hypothetical protein
VYNLPNSLNGNTQVLYIENESGEKMNTKNKTSTLLGIAFLFQAVTAAISKGILFDPLIAEGDITQSMLNIANKSWMLSANILFQMITAMGINFLGVMLYRSLKKHGNTIALVALGFYVFEATLIAVSRIDAFSLLRISQEFVATGQPEYLKIMGKLALNATQYGYVLHMLPFCVGAMLFYYLLYKSKVIPRGLSLWGLITLVPCLIATIIELFGFYVPIYVYLPYAPFEFVVGIWILAKGMKNKDEIQEDFK